jgi:hypothetical protein
MSSYLDCLLHVDFLTYWDYINLNTLLSLQNTLLRAQHVRSKTDSALLLLLAMTTFLMLHINCLIHKREQCMLTGRMQIAPYLINFSIGRCSLQATKRI